jgi:hypothetical protein
MNFWDILGIWIAAFLTLAILSLVIKENPIYRFAEHIFVGVSAGYGLVNTIQQAIWPQIKGGLLDEKYLIFKLGEITLFGQKVAFLSWGQFSVILGIILGLMIITKLEIFGYIPVVRDFRWIALFPLAYTIGIYTGIGLTATFQGFIYPQIRATFLPLWGENFWQVFSNWVFVLGVITSIMYFFFSTEHKGIMKPIVRLGIIFIMVAFGASFGYTVMGRISLLLGRIYFLFNQWLPTITGIFG